MMKLLASSILFLIVLHVDLMVFNSIMLKYTAPSIAGTLTASWNITLHQYPNLPHHLPPLLIIVPSLFFLSYQNFLKNTHTYNILLDFVQSHSLIAYNQFGFLPSRSTFLALLSSTYSILSAFDSYSYYFWCSPRVHIRSSPFSCIYQWSL